MRTSVSKLSPTVATSPRRHIARISFFRPSEHHNRPERTESPFLQTSGTQTNSHAYKRHHEKSTRKSKVCAKKCTCPRDNAAKTLRCIHHSRSRLTAIFPCSYKTSTNANSDSIRPHAYPSNLRTPTVPTVDHDPQRTAK